LSLAALTIWASVCLVATRLFGQQGNVDLLYFTGVILALLIFIPALYYRKIVMSQRGLSCTSKVYLTVFFSTRPVFLLLYSLLFFNGLLVYIPIFQPHKSWLETNGILGWMGVLLFFTTLLGLTCLIVKRYMEQR
jgi:hypothetical protein